MSTNHKFTGGDTLTGLEKIIHNVLMQNELSNGNGAYKLSKAPGANSGFSFGGNQMDMSKNKAAREDFVKILKNSVDENNNKIFQFRDIKIILGKDSINITESGKTLNKTFNNYLPKINQALSSDYGKKVINEAYVRELEYGIEYCKKMVNNLKNPAAKEYYSDDKGFVKLFDYHNQFNIGHNSPLIHNYIDGSIKGKHKVHYGTKESQQAPTDEYTDIHHKEYLEGTKYYVDQENIIKNAKLKQAAAEKIDPVKAAASPVKIPVNDIDRRLDNIEDILSKHGVKQDEPKEVQLNDDNVDFNMVTEPSQPSVDVEKELSTIEEEVNKEPNEIERLIQEDMLTLKYSLDENLLKLELAILQVANSVEVSKEQSELVIGSVMRNMVEQLDWYKDKHFSKTGFDFGIKGIRERFIDPLALDLDNKGIQLTDENDPPVLFDLYGTGVKIKTQWLKPGSGWLVLDLNKNGVIDSGKEMFGDKTVLKNGELARNGFNALKEYDVNRDGVIDKRDPIFEELQIWQDFNQDGISQPEELFTLPELGIDSIKISNTWEGYVNNIYVHRNIFTKIDEKPNSSVGLTNYVINLNLSVTPFYREFTTKIELSEEAKNLPDMKGAGTLRDLREAMSLSPALAKVVTEYIHADTINKDRY